METTHPFYDFCVPYNNNRTTMVQMLDELYDLGYRTIAIEQTYVHGGKNDAKKGNDPVPEPVNLDFLSKFKGKLGIYNRLTIVFADPGVSVIMNKSTNLKKYHLVAGLPRNAAALMHCCTTFNGDIIACNPEDGKLSISYKTYQVAVKRHMCFEIKYNPIITDSTQRRNMIKISLNYHTKGKSRNIIFSSGATNKFELRGPYDIANLALFFGLSEEQGKNAISGTCRTLFINAESRRIGKTILYVQQTGPMVLSSSSEEDTDEESAAEMEDVEQMELKTSEIVDSDNEDSVTEQPSKKKKLS